jgi:hypothetical protein
VATSGVPSLVSVLDDGEDNIGAWLSIQDDGERVCNPPVSVVD